MGVPAGSAGLVSLDDVKTHLGITSSTRDAELQGFVDAATKIIEFHAGAVVPAAITEWYDGGHHTLVLRRRPVISVASIVEYLGPTAYPLTQVASPDLGTIYSYTIDTSGIVVRHTAGGGIQAFPGGPDTVQVTYTAGRVVVPANIRLAGLELIRHMWDQPRGGKTVLIGEALNDEPITPTASGFAVPYRVLELLAPNKRAPRIA